MPEESESKSLLEMINEDAASQPDVAKLNMNIAPVADEGKAAATSKGEEDNAPLDAGDDTEESAEEGEGDEGQEDGDTSVEDFRASFKELTGLDLEGDYDDVEAAKAGVAETLARSKQQDAAAANWQSLMEAAQEDPRILDSLKQALRGETAGKPPAAGDSQPSADASKEEMPRSFEELQLWQSMLRDDKGNLKEDADPKVVARVTAFSRRMNEVLFDLVTNPDKLFTPHAAKIKEELLQTSRQETAQQVAIRQRQEQFEEITRQNSDKLFVDGDAKAAKLTPFGFKVRQAYNDLVGDGMPEGPAALKRAIQFASSAIASPQPTRKVSSRAGRKPPVAPAPADEFDEEKFFAEGGGLVDLLNLRMNRK